MLPRSFDQHVQGVLADVLAKKSKRSARETMNFSLAELRTLHLFANELREQGRPLRAYEPSEALIIRVVGEAAVALGLKGFSPAIRSRMARMRVNYLNPVDVPGGAYRLSSFSGACEQIGSIIVSFDRGEPEKARMDAVAKLEQNLSDHEAFLVNHPTAARSSREHVWKQLQGREAVMNAQQQLAELSLS